MRVAAAFLAAGRVEFGADFVGVGSSEIRVQLVGLSPVLVGGRDIGQRVGEAVVGARLLEAVTAVDGEGERGGVPAGRDGVLPGGVE
jgi:hypothetical protein